MEMEVNPVRVCVGWIRNATYAPSPCTQGGLLVILGPSYTFWRDAALSLCSVTDLVVHLYASAYMRTYLLPTLSHTHTHTVYPLSLLSSSLCRTEPSTPASPSLIWCWAARLSYATTTVIIIIQVTHIYFLWYNTLRDTAYVT